MNKILSTLSNSGVILTTPEFVSLVVFKLTGRHVPLELLYDLAKQQGAVFEKLSHDADTLEEYSTMPMFEDTYSDPEIENILGNFSEQRDFSKLASHTDTVRSGLDLHDAQYPWGDRRGMYDAEYYTDPKTGKKYATTVGSIEDAKLWDKWGAMGKAGLAALGLSGLYMYFKNAKSPLTPIAGVAAVVLGGKFLLDALNKSDRGIGKSDSGMRLPVGVSMLEKKSGWNPFRSKPKTIGEKINKSLKGGIRSGRAASFYIPVAGTAALNKYYEDRLRKGKVGYYADELEHKLEGAGKWAYNHPVLTGGAAMLAGHTGVSAADALRKAIFKR